MSKILNSLFEYGSKAAKATGKAAWSATKSTARYTYNHREQIGGAIVGTAKGIGEAGKGLYGYTISKEQIEEKINILTKQAAEYKQLQDRLKFKNRFVDKKQILFDSLVMSSAVGFEYYDTNVIPDDIIEAYSLAYPNLAREYSLEQIIDNASTSDAIGYINGIKGKLFEIRYADYLNSSNVLPEGYHAELATSATNPGWDLAIVDNFGHISETLQLKATENIAYVQQAFETYPDIPIVSTSEVYNELAMKGMADNIIDSGISNTELTDMVADTFDNNVFDFDWCPSIVPFLIIGYSVARKKELTKYQKGKEFGGRAFSSYLGYIAGGAVTALTGGFWVAGIAAAVMTNTGLEIGRQKLKYYNSLKDSIKFNDRILNRLRTRLVMT